MCRWIPLQVELGNFHQRRTIYIFAIKASLLSVLLSLLVVVAVLPLMSWCGLLTIALSDSVRLGILLSWLIGGVVSGILAILTGHAIHDISVSRAEFERLSRTDTLSGLFNRRAFAEALGSVVGDASLVIFDVDRFKSVNDQYGHSAGDAVIVAISAQLALIFKDEAVVGRLGGEEFGVLVYGGSVVERVTRIEAAKARICSTNIPIACGDINVTISAGIADFEEGRGPEAVYAAADNALYLAKALGRNRVVHEGERHIALSRHGATSADGIAPADDFLPDPPRYQFGM